MNSNYRRQNNTGQFAAALRWVIIVAFFSVAGLSYVYLKNQMHIGGLQKGKLENELSELISQNNVMQSRIADLTAPTTLQRRLVEGFIKLVPINTQAVVHVRTADSNRWATTDRSTSAFHPVSHDIAVNHR